MNPTTAVLSHWFKKRLKLALGLMAVGSSLGGTVIPIATRNLLPLVGYVYSKCGRFRHTSFNHTAGSNGP